MSGNRRMACTQLCDHKRDWPTQNRIDGSAGQPFHVACLISFRTPLNGCVAATNTSLSSQSRWRVPLHRPQCNPTAGAQ